MKKAGIKLLLVVALILDSRPDATAAWTMVAGGPPWIENDESNPSSFRVYCRVSITACYWVNGNMIYVDPSHWGVITRNTPLPGGSEVVDVVQHSEPLPVEPPQQ